MQVIFYIIAKHFFLNYDIFHKRLSNKEILIALWLLPYKLCKNNLWNLIGINFVQTFLIWSLQGISRAQWSPSIIYFWLMYWDSLWGEEKTCFYLCSFSHAYFFSHLENNLTNFSHCLNVDGEKLWQKN